MVCIVDAPQKDRERDGHGPKQLSDRNARQNDWCLVSKGGGKETTNREVGVRIQGR